MKKVWFSKIVLVGVLQFVYGAVMLVAEFLEAASFNPVAIASLVCGLLLIVFRIWFSDSSLEF